MDNQQKDSIIEEKIVLKIDQEESSDFSENIQQEDKLGKNSGDLDENKISHDYTGYNMNNKYVLGGSLIVGAITVLYGGYKLFMIYNKKK